MLFLHASGKNMTPLIYKPPNDPLVVLYHDDALILVDKPSGLLSVAGKTPDLADCLLTRVRAQFAGALLVHRLDLDTSGVMVFARTKAAQRDLSRQFEQRLVSKTYIALAQGHFVDDTGMVDIPLGVDWPNRPLQQIDYERGKTAQTYWQVLKHIGDCTRIKLRPITGRSHQLRVHMQALGHPILGDRFYGDGASAPRLMLHARDLHLNHPVHNKRIKIATDMPF